MNPTNHAALVSISLIALGACTFEIAAPEQLPAPGESSAGENEGHDNHDPSTGTDPLHQRAVALVAGAGHACALAASGEVSCWGNNDVGQLGYGHTDPIGDDESVGAHGAVAVGGPVASLAAGAEHTCAIMETGTIRCWGYGGDLALGNGNHHPDTVGDDESPAEMGDAIIYSNSPIVQLTAGDHHSCMRTELGAVKCWGDSPQGALGYGYGTKTGGWLGNVPIGGNVSFLVAGAEHTCAVVDGGKVRCWGESTALGYGDTGNVGDDEQITQLPALSLGEAVTQLAAGARHTCALTASGAVRCWGQGLNGQLGYASSQSVATAWEAGIVNVGGAAVQIAAGRSHTCALSVQGSVHCWGEGSFGALGYGNIEDVGDDEMPAVAGVVELPEPVSQIAAGDDFTCALLQSGAVQCWGSGRGGQLGYGNEWTIGDNETPAVVEPIRPFGN